MKIAQIADLWHPAKGDSVGGRGFITGALTEGLVKRGHEVTLFASGDSTKAGRLISVVEKALKHSDLELTVLNLAKAYSMDGEFDIIQNHVGHMALPFASMSKTPSLTTIHYPREDDVTKSYFETFKNASYFSSLSFALQKFYPMLSYVGNVYNGIYINDFIFNDSPEDYLLVLARISPDKGIQFAVEAAKRANEKLIIAGMVPEPDRAYFENVVKPLIDNDRVKYIGEVNYQQKIPLLSNAKALLQTSDFFEVCPVAPLEAMASGTPVIAFNVGSIAEIVKDKETGFVVEKEDIEVMVEGIKNIDNIDRKACRKRVEENFTVEKMVDGYEGIYRKIYNL